MARIYEIQIEIRHLEIVRSKLDFDYVTDVELNAIIYNRIKNLIQEWKALKKGEGALKLVVA